MLRHPSRGWLDAAASIYQCRGIRLAGGCMLQHSFSMSRHAQYSMPYFVFFFSSLAFISLSITYRAYKPSILYLRVDFWGLKISMPYRHVQFYTFGASINYSLVIGHVEPIVWQETEISYRRHSNIFNSVSRCRKKNYRSIDVELNA